MKEDVLDDFEDEIGQPLGGPGYSFSPTYSCHHSRESGNSARSAFS
jgi:hypothetical protein